MIVIVRKPLANCPVVVNIFFKAASDKLNSLLNLENIPASKFEENIDLNLVSKLFKLIIQL